MIPATGVGDLGGRGKSEEIEVKQFSSQNTTIAKILRNGTTTENSMHILHIDSSLTQVLEIWEKSADKVAAT